MRAVAQWVEDRLVIRDVQMKAGTGSSARHGEDYEQCVEESLLRNRHEEPE